MSVKNLNKPNWWPEGHLSKKATTRTFALALPDDLMERIVKVGTKLQNDTGIEISFAATLRMLLNKGLTEYEIRKKLGARE